jgi:hypothetical protein
LLDGLYTRYYSTEDITTLRSIHQFTRAISGFTADRLYRMIEMIQI